MKKGALTQVKVNVAISIARSLRFATEPMKGWPESSCFHQSYEMSQPKFRVTHLRLAGGCNARNLCWKVRRRISWIYHRKSHDGRGGGNRAPDPLLPRQIVYIICRQHSLEVTLAWDQGAWLK